MIMVMQMIMMMTMMVIITPTMMSTKDGGDVARLS